MKKMFIVLMLIVYVGITYGQTLRKDFVYTLHVMEVNLKSGVTMGQFMNVVHNEYLPAGREAFPDVKVVLMEGIRGKHENSLGFMGIYESEEALKKYWPESGISSDLYKEQIKMVVPARNKMKELADFDWVTWTSWKVDTTSGVENYSHTLQKGNVFTLHVLEVNPKSGKTMDQFMDVVHNEYLPALNEAFPDVPGPFLKAIRGEHENMLGLMGIYESEEGLKKYWPETGDASKPYEASELNKERMKIVLPVRKKMAELAEYDWVTWTTWKVDFTPEKTTGTSSLIPERDFNFSIYPNPFTDYIVFENEFQNPEIVSIQIYNSLGQLVATPVNNVQQLELKEINWNGRDDSGNVLKDGIYFVQLTTPNSFGSTVKIIKIAQ